MTALTVRGVLVVAMVAAAIIALAIALAPASHHGHAGMASLFLA